MGRVHVGADLRLGKQVQLQIRQQGALEAATKAATCNSACAPTILSAGELRKLHPGVGQDVVQVAKPPLPCTRYGKLSVQRQLQMTCLQGASASARSGSAESPCMLKHCAFACPHPFLRAPAAPLPSR